MSAPLATSKLSAVPLSAPAALALGSQVEAYTVLKVLAEGRHGFVYLTRHAVHGTTCVLKEFMPRLHAMRLGDGSVSPRHAGDAIAMSVARIEFMQEATILAGIEQPGLVRVLGLIEANRTLYRVMPFYDGVTLQQHCRLRGGVPSVAWLAGIVDDLLRALEPVHARGRAHGRVQPNQVLVSSSQRATLLGFGSVARELDDPPADPWRASEASGAHRHLRPEPAGDLYALAATAWFAVTGVAPPTTAERRASPLVGARELLAGVGDRADDPPHVRRGLIQALDAGMAAAIGSRPQTVAEFRRLLQGESSIQVLPVTMAPRWVGAEVAAAGCHGPLQSPPPVEPASAAVEGVEPTLRVVAASATVGLAEAAPAAADHAATVPAEAQLSVAEPVASLRAASALAGFAPGSGASIEAAPAPSAQFDAMRGAAAAIVPPAVTSGLAPAAPLSAAPGETVPVSIATGDADLVAAAPVAGSDVAALFSETAPLELAAAAVLPASTAAPQSTLAQGVVAAGDPGIAPDAASAFTAAVPVEATPPESVPVRTAAAEAPIDAEPLAAKRDVVADVAAAITEAVPVEVAPAEPAAALNEADLALAAPLLVAATPAIAADVVAEAAQATPDDVAPAQALPELILVAEAPAATGLTVAASALPAHAESAATQAVPDVPVPIEVALCEPVLVSTATAKSAPAGVEVDGCVTAGAAQAPLAVAEGAPGDAQAVETEHAASVSVEGERAEAGGVVTLPASAAFVVMAPDQAAPPPRETARPAAPEASAAALPPAPGLDSLRRGRWHGAALVVAAAVLAAASINWWTPSGEVAPSLATSRQAPAVAPREQTPVAPVTTKAAPVAPGWSATDVATTPPAGVATAAPAIPTAEAPAADIVAIPVAAPPAPPRAAPRRAVLARAQAQAPRAVMSRSAAPRATPRSTALRAMAPRAAPPRAPSVPGAKGVGTSGKPGLPKSPVAACAKAAQFSSCMRQLCAKPGNRQHVQCVQFRRKA